MWTLIATALTSIASGVINIFNKKTADITQENQQNSAIDIENAKINQVEAANPNLFVSGWRPYVGWMCAFSLTYAWIIHMIASDILFAIKGVSLPPIDTSEIYGVLVGLLGIATLRTYEKRKGLTK